MGSASDGRGDEATVNPQEAAAILRGLSEAVAAMPGEARTIHDAMVASGLEFKDTRGMSLHNALAYYSHIIGQADHAANNHQIREAINRLRDHQKQVVAKQHGPIATMDDDDIQLIKFLIICILLCA